MLAKNPIFTNFLANFLTFKAMNNKDSYPSGVKEDINRDLTSLVLPDFVFKYVTACQPRCVCALRIALMRDGRVCRRLVPNDDRESFKYFNEKAFWQWCARFATMPVFSTPDGQHKLALFPIVEWSAHQDLFVRGRAPPILPENHPDLLRKFLGGSVIS